ncbi:transcription initiation factor TFIID subunit 2 isoform X1 [Physcomitrium patens]|uniref:Transcription initiation factor TFIID subunit 2 n=2 Tax=Physcomitrium patens TaxID=3218 RepID=A0A2K1J026_PHYPA|nr:transcription initiation factor TFIID subunit 2-like isoform X1 [Physcomitrium patens]XP_024402346.1 transcription initiation factor TFIID subunit 2-like isoform X1 [Physcomitrium patens]XP_024402347.1 transcription initiation factor TFIID subunit 2-like isoform X1 [Physcomitrium patens]XP_024402348.1 transcription initiation factor TFIID subunit 2-like isoform X1 [Physcomitrium patens]XP_024402349.1 transcription initiation factor TFIID subunit 2-like isoform X1 [Physcomitrium patens]XP_02|eukprot:XP_024402345.1 transcription initiation factor TFIID subunit 2-like isoform X1 [Physcomitrella patens]
MAKQRKQKQKEQRPSDIGVIKSNEGVASSCCTILHQKLCVVIDLAAQRIYGHTELKVAVKQGGKVGEAIGLHARDLHIEQVLVDGVEAQFEVLNQKHFSEVNVNDGPHPAPYTKSNLEAADDAYKKYSGDLYAESLPELLVYPPPSSTPTGPGQVPEMTLEVDAGLENGFSQSGFDTKSESANLVAPTNPQSEEVKILRVDYWVEKPPSGGHFEGHLFYTNNQLRRARCWFPCVDSTLQRCSFDLEFTVRSEYVAVSNGKLLHQVYSNEGTHLKTYVYSLPIPTAASYVSLVVAPLVVLPDRHHSNVSHLCMPGLEATLNSSINTFHTVFSLYEEYLGAPFPFGCYKQVFLPGDAVISTSSVGASLATFSADLLADEHIIDQAISTRIKLAYALAQQWFGIFITPDSPADDWLLEGLAGMLTDLFVKRFLGNNEARFRRYKANEAVCVVEVEGAPVLSPPAGLDMAMCGTEKLGVLGKIRIWKATAVVQMLEKQMGPEPFRKVLQRIIMRAQDPNRKNRTLSTTEFRHFANKLGNLERPFLKDFFPRWVESSGCPRLRMGFVYSKRRNMVELAVHRESTAMPKHVGVIGKVEAPESKLRLSDMGWPGMMSIRLHELDGMYDHPSLPMAGDCYQLLELQCHSKLAGRRIQRPKKGAKGEAVEDNVDATPAQSLESPLLWIRGDPELEYLAELNLRQPEPMWINQLEKDRDVIGQIQAVAALRAYPRTSFAVVNALNNCLIDPKVFCRVRIEAAAALASTASEGTSYMGLQNLLKYYKSRRFDPDIGLPKPNDFHDFSEYFVLEAIPGAVAEVRGSDGKSPLEATDFILHILKHNDNSGNAYSDVFWLASVIESIGSLEFGKQNLRTLARMLKQIDRFLQYDRLMPSYNGVVTISCIHTLAKLAIRFSHALPTERVKQLLNQFKDRQKVQWQVRVAALKALLDIELQSKGLEAAVNLALQQVHGDLSFGVQSKIMKHVVRMASITEKGKCRIGGVTIARLLALLESSKAFHNVMLRHSIFSFLQVLAGRSASLYRSAEFLAKLAPNHVSQDKRFAKTKNLFKLRLRPTQSPAPPAPQSEPLKLRLILPSSSKDNADRAESESSGGKRFSIKLKLSKSSSAHEGAGDDTSQALEVSTGAVPMDHHVANSPLSVKEEVNLHEVIDSNLGFSQLESSRTQPLDNHPDESQILDTHNIHVGVEGDTQDTTAQGNEEMKYRDVEGTEELVHEDTEGGGSPRRSYHANTYPESDSRASTEQEPPFDLYGEDTQDGMGESRDDSRKALGVSRTMESDLQGYNSLSGMIDAENSTQDGGFEETESLRRVEKQSGDKKERKHDKKDKKDRKDKKKKKKHDKHNDPEYLEKKRKRKEEREQRHRQEGHKSSKEEKHRKEDSHEKVEEKPAFDAPMNDYSQSEGTKVENQGGNDIMKIKFKFKKPRTTTSDR